MGPLKKYVTCIMAFFTPFNFVTLCYFYSITSPLLFPKLHQETIEWEKKRFFAYMAGSAYRVTSKEAENQMFRHNWNFRHTFVYKQPTLTKQWNFLCKYYIVISDIRVGFFLDVLFLLLAVILSELYEKPRRNKDWVTEKNA